MTTPSGEIEWIGPHEFKFVAPDEVHVTVHGNFEPDHFDAHLDYLTRITARCGGSVYCLVDAKHAGRMTEGLRRRMTSSPKGYPYRACAIVGAGFTMKTVFNMILTAGRALAPNATQFPVRFLADVESAQAWFQSLRSLHNSS